MKIFYFMCLGLFGCSEFVSTFYGIGQVDERGVDVDAEVAIEMGGLKDDGVDMKRLWLDQGGSSQGGTMPRMDMLITEADMLITKADMLITETDMLITDTKVCEASFVLKIGENPELRLDGCQSWSMDLNYQYDPDTPPEINGGTITFKAVDGFECDLIFEFTALSCGLDQVYKVGSQLNIQGCRDLADQYEGLYHINQDQGLIISFSEINTGNENGSFSGLPLFTKLSGHIGTLPENGITLSNQQGSFQSYLYGSFSISSVEVRNDVDMTFSCSQNADVTVYDFDEDGESTLIYGYGNRDCDDRNPMANSMRLEGCRPCGANCPEIEMILIQAGSFNMGSNTNASEQPIHNVQIRSNFYVGKTEVTVGQYRACVSAGQCSAPNDTTSNRYCNWTSSVGTKETHPVNCVDWNQARTFAKWIGGDLLTEAQWEYVATGQGQAITYPWGNAEPTCQLANYSGCVGSTAPVCSTTGGNTTQDVCDMGGNVWEWVLDEWHDSYSGAPSDDIGWCSDRGCESNYSADRVYRGGSWGNSASALRSALRYHYSPGSRSHYLGFRVSDIVP